MSNNKHSVKNQKNKNNNSKNNIKILNNVIERSNRPNDNNNIKKFRK